MVRQVESGQTPEAAAEAEAAGLPANDSKMGRSISEGMASFGDRWHGITGRRAGLVNRIGLINRIGLTAA